MGGETTDQGMALSNWLGFLLGRRKALQKPDAALLDPNSFELL